MYTFVLQAGIVICRDESYAGASGTAWKTVFLECRGLHGAPCSGEIADVSINMRHASVNTLKSRLCKHIASYSNYQRCAATNQYMSAFVSEIQPPLCSRTFHRLASRRSERRIRRRLHCLHTLLQLLTTHNEPPRLSRVELDALSRIIRTRGATPVIQ